MYEQKSREIFTGSNFAIQDVKCSSLCLFWLAVFYGFYHGQSPFQPPFGRLCLSFFPTTSSKFAWNPPKQGPFHAKTRVIECFQVSLFSAKSHDFLPSLFFSVVDRSTGTKTHPYHPWDWYIYLQLARFIPIGSMGLAYSPT